MSAITPAGGGAEPGALCSGITSSLACETRARACASRVSLPPRARDPTRLWARRGQKRMALLAARVRMLSVP